MAIRKNTAAKPGEAIDVLRVLTGSVTCLIRGTSPLIFNRMAEKAKRELLFPKGRKTAADKAQNLKHNPVEEFKASVYRWDDDSHPTRLKLPAPAFKGAISTAALEVPGMKRAQIGRLVWVEGAYVDVYGVPELLMSVVRSADINKTPDIRTRAILREWCCEITMSFIRPTLNSTGVATLLSAAGLMVGVGDFRQEKGKGNFGQFSVVDSADATFKRIMRDGGRKAQDAMLDAASPFDDETGEMMVWYNAEIIRRGRQGDGKPDDDPEPDGDPDDELEEAAD